MHIQLLTLYNISCLNIDKDVHYFKNYFMDENDEKESRKDTSKKK